MQWCRVNIGFGCGCWSGLHSLPVVAVAVVRHSELRVPVHRILFISTFGVAPRAWSRDPELAKRIFVRWVRVSDNTLTQLSTSFLVAHLSIPPLQHFNSRCHLYLFELPAPRGVTNTTLNTLAHDSPSMSSQRKQSSSRNHTTSNPPRLPPSFTPSSARPGRSNTQQRHQNHYLIQA
jgi:hypothetical protein